MRPAANISPRFRSARRVSAASLALPLVMALGLSVAPAASAQSSAGSLSSNSPGSGTGYLDPENLPKRTPQKVTEQPLQGLPEGVSVDRVEWITDRWANVFINSKAMPGKPIKVQILLARDWYKNPDKKFPTVWALDGLRARDDESGWTLATNITSFYADKNVNVVLPVGGESSFYTDWQQPEKGKHYKWESFLTQELPAVLREGWRSNEDRAIVGLSMGGTAAMNLAERFPKMWKFVGSFSGYLDTTSFGMPQAIGYATNDGGGYDAQKMWGPYGSQDWIDHDPKLGIKNLGDTTVYVSAGNGNAGKYDKPGALPGMPSNMAGFGLEAMSRMTTETFVQYAKKANKKVITQFRPSGTHDWPYWQFEMTQAWPHIADTFGLAEDDRGASCKPVGAIAAAVGKYPNLGACISDEYDGANKGKVQDFRGGRAYWSPATGAHFLWGRIGALYASLKGTHSWLGYPKSEEITISGGRGRFVEFEHGNIYWSPQTGAVAVAKDIMEAWGKKQYENGPLGYPIAEAKKMGDGWVQEFENGVITRDKDGKTQYVQGEIAKKYMSVKGAESKLGFPVTGENDLPGGKGKLSEFTGGYIYWSPATGAKIIHKGAIFDAWGEEKWEQGKYGLPVEDQKSIPAGGETVKFQGGEISEINGKIVKK